MKVRKLAVALALAGGLGSGVAQALGLGEIELQSYLNEPLDAEINLRKSEGVSPGDVFVNLAPESAYERVGIDRNFFLTKLDFEVTTAPDGSLVVNVSSREPLREPYLNFLIEVTWPNGRLMREYAVLVDPPVYSEESGAEEQVSAPSTSSSQRSQPQQQARQSAPAQSTQSTRQTSTSGSRTLGPTNSSDTLWTIAAQIRPNRDVSMQQVMLAIQDLNPDAFIAGNINRLKRGEVLRIPDENQIRSRSTSEANREVAAQNESFSSPQRTVDATGESEEAQSTETAGSSDGDQLRLLAADDSGQRDSDDGGSAGGDGDTAGGADTGSAVAMEELESARRENEELTGRVDDLQDQVETLQRLLELKNTQLAEIQSGQGDAPEGEVAADGEPSAEVGEPSAEVGEPSAETDEPADPEVAEDSPGEQQELASDETAADSMEEDGAEAEAGTDADTGTELASDESGEAEGSAGSAEEQQADEQAVAEQSETAEAEEPATEPAAPADTGPAQKPFPGNIIDAISNNFMYQVALGGGLVVLLLLLLLLARRNANREKAFYDQLNNETPGAESDSFDLTFDEEEDAVAPDDDAIAEADAYIAYGRNDQAAHTLETAISREPSRTDLRLKLLGVYADIQDRESFDKQFREIEALEDDAAIAEAQNLQNHLEEAESMPSIDDLESQLRSGGSDDDRDVEEKTSFESEYNIDDYEEPKTEEPDFGDLELDLPESDEDQPDSIELESGDAAESSEEDRDDLIEYDLSGMETAEEADTDDAVAAPESDESDELDEPFDFSLEESDLPEEDKADRDPVESERDDEDDLSLDFDTSDLEDDEVEAAADAEESKPAPVAEETDDETGDLELDDDGELDESFLDELDAELDKVAGEDDIAGEEGESDLDDLELDVSDEDLALMEEFSESDEEGPADAPENAEDDELSLDDELGLEDTLKGEEPGDPEQEIEGAEQADEMLSEGGPVDGPADDSADEDDFGDDAVVPPVASDPASGRDSNRDIDEADLGDDDDFDFLSGTDEAATKLDLARAYVEMGDVDGARDILEEVALEGNDEQKAEAQDLLKNLS